MESTGLRDRSHRHERLDEDWLHLFALDEMAEVLRAEPAYPVNGHTGITLHKTTHLRILLEVAKEGAEIGEHSVHGPTFIHVLSGSLRLTSGGETRLAQAGELVVIPQVRVWTMIADEDSSFLLGLSLEMPEPLHARDGSEGS
jgi:quercetin dioxygenase-like cupin family protein